MHENDFLSHYIPTRGEEYIVSRKIYIPTFVLILYCNFNSVFQVIRSSVNKAKIYRWQYLRNL